MTSAKRNMLIWVLCILGGGWLTTALTSCGKATTGSPQLLNIQYHVLNLSPDLLPVDLFIDIRQVNSTPYYFGVDQGYFYIPSTDTPYQVRSAINTGTTWLHRDDILKSGAKYTLYIVGAVADNSLTSVLTVDTGFSPPAGTGGLRLVNVSPTALGGLTLYANGTTTKDFTGVVYQKASIYDYLPAGNYDLQVDATGTTTILSEQPSVTIQNGRLYTIYAYGYTSRADSAGFATQVTTNQ
jgi:hypothetical protein